MQSEAKQTESLEFGAEKGLVQDKQGERMACAKKTPELPEGFQGEVFIGKIWGESCSVCDFLWIGWL